MVNSDPYERQYLIRLISAARTIANNGTIDHKDYICSADAARELRAALWSLDSLHEQRDREEQERSEQETEDGR